MIVSNSWLGRLRTKLVYPSFRYTCEHRKVHRYIEEGKRGIGYYYHRYKLLKYSIKFGYQINAETKVGPGLYFGHRGTVIVNGNAVLGANVNLATGVTIGQENRGKRKGCPTIGNFLMYLNELNALAEFYKEKGYQVDVAILKQNQSYDDELLKIL